MSFHHVCRYKYRYFNYQDAYSMEGWSWIDDAEAEKNSIEINFQVSWHLFMLLNLSPLSFYKFCRRFSVSLLRHWHLKASGNSHNKHLWIISFSLTQDTKALTEFTYIYELLA